MCADQGVLNGIAADVFYGASLTCKDSFLVGWGGASDQEDIGCPVLMSGCPGSTLKLQGCTVQLHPDSTHPKPAVILMATDHASITASGCKFIGPAPGSQSREHGAAAALEQAAIALVSAAACILSQHPGYRRSCNHFQTCVDFKCVHMLMHLVDRAPTQPGCRQSFVTLMYLT
jgi:hypothetical protein